MLAGLAGVMWVIEFGTINGTAAIGRHARDRGRGGRGRSERSSAGAAPWPGPRSVPCSLRFIANALLLVGSRSSGCRRSTAGDPARDRERPADPTAPARGSPARVPDDGHRCADPDACPRGFRLGCALARWETVLAFAPARPDRAGQRLLAVLPDPPELFQPARRPDGSGDHGAAAHAGHHPRRDRPVGGVDGRSWPAPRSASSGPPALPLEIGIPVVLVIGAAGRPAERALLVRGGLPSLVVTLGTLALFRGMAIIMLGPLGISDFPPGSPSSGSATSRAR